jgi:hypothetical protein
MLDSASDDSYLFGVMRNPAMPSATSYYYYATRYTGRVRSRMR